MRFLNGVIAQTAGWHWAGLCLGLIAIAGADDRHVGIFSAVAV